MPNEEIIVEVTTEPSNPEPTETSQSLEVLVGELKAKNQNQETQIEELKKTLQEINNNLEMFKDVQRWTSEEIGEIARNLYQEMSQMRSDVEELSENVIENTEEESEPNLEEIPAIPEVIEQEEPEESVEVKRRRPWFL